MKPSLLILFVLFAALARVPAAQEQPAPAGAQRFSKDGLSFDYPAGWTITDNSNPQSQSLVLRRAGISTIIMVFAQREPVRTAEQLYASRANITMPYVASIARRLGLEKAPPANESECVEVGGFNAVGFRLAGRVEKEPTTAEVYTVVLGERLLHLVHIRADKEEAQGAAAWKSVLDTLKVIPAGAVRIEPPGGPHPESERIKNIVSGGVLNGRALKKPQPDYPRPAKAARASGTVVVQIAVDEKGDVISAEAVSGHPLLRPAGEEAAKRAKFSPTTLCGKPVKVTGVITYNFVLQ